MLGARERWIFVYDINVSSSPQGAPRILLRAAVEQLLPRYGRGECVKLINNDTAAIRIQRLRIDEPTGTIQLLINYADSEAVDPVFANLQTGDLRSEPKLRGEGIAVSAHMLISLEPHPQNGTYLVALEDVPGVGRTKLAPFFTSEFKAVADFRFRDADDRVKQSRPIINILGHPSQQLRDDLDHGTLSEIDLVRVAPVATDFDEEGHLQEESRSIRLKAKGRLRGLDALDLINRIGRRARAEGYESLKVRFKRDVGNTRTVNVPTVREDAGDVQYVRYERLDAFEAPMEQSVSEIRDDMVAKMMVLFDEIRDAWPP